MQVSNSVVVITGGAKGLGKTIATMLVHKGARVVICDKDKVELEHTSKDLNILGLLADITTESDVLDVAQKAVSTFGRIDVWINNAGVWMPPQTLEEVDLKKAANLFQINFFGTIHGMRSAIKQMKQQKGGTIINIISTTAFDGMNGSSGSLYVASKYALRGLTNVTRDELEQDNIKVIGVYPGGIKTGIFNEARPKNIDQFMSTEEVAQKIVENLEQVNPEPELVIKRPGQTLSPELV